ncbi:hypothetical protein DL766_007404 [Monosporascus sp. MC13-8B]|uniref:Uncharacterized protein n=1 Tax=Monosporascus cannonballus TaxID=155416 RepID=A0ABY0H9S4_9PEZI|nr:hypothetical protein DL762_003714 [Monosporascus cannonballus]RYP00570.1 hypothetical protein DL763_000767 [Monosporascus cannonballus]RYP23897.1 hypothetical protein DL766_007404 [Monosporascus sp. MC13-8B]
MRRAINSTLRAFAPVSTRQKIMLLPELTEAARTFRASGSTPPLRREFGDRVDRDAVPKQWNRLDPSSQFAYGLGEIEARATAAREWLMELALAAGEGSHVVDDSRAHRSLHHGRLPGRQAAQLHVRLARQLGIPFVPLRLRLQGDGRDARKPDEKGDAAGLHPGRGSEERDQGGLRRRILERTPEVLELYEDYKL